MAGNKKKTNSKCRFLAYLGIVVLSAFIYVDVRQNGSWTNSCTSKALNRTGVYTYTHKAYDRASECTQWMFDNFEKTFPDFTRYTIQYSKPYLELGHDVCLVLKNIGHNINEGIQSKVPIVIDTIETYAPGLIDQTQELGRNIWAKTIVYYEIGHEYLMTQVFIGKFAPEEIQKTVASSMHTGYEKAQEYYSWLYNKIMSAIK